MNRWGTRLAAAVLVGILSMSSALAQVSEPKPVTRERAELAVSNRVPAEALAIQQLSARDAKAYFNRMPTKEWQAGLNSVRMGAWWGGYYYDIVDNFFLENDVAETKLQEYLRLGSGMCEERATTWTVSGSIQGSAGSDKQASINKSFGFSVSGSRSWSHTMKRCGPNEPDKTRLFFRHVVYNSYSSHIDRFYYTWNHWYVRRSEETREVQVPHDAWPTRDISA